jgi:hypothetical protein
MSTLWGLMQDIEAMRHLADVLEARLPAVPATRRAVYETLVPQLRDAAQLAYDLSRAVI